jgi:hypothetical protein
MTEKQAMEAVLERWETAWEALHPEDAEDPNHVPYTFENEEFRAAPSWARVALVHTSTKQVTMGQAPNRQFERRGNVVVQLFGVVDRGRAPLDELAGDVRTVLEGRSLAVTAGDAITIYAGQTDEKATDGAWHMVNITLPFRYYETR